MGSFAYLINSDVPGNGASRSTLKGKPHAVIEGPRTLVPLPWVCCFRSADLAPSKAGPGPGLRLPATSVKAAIENLNASLPRYERMVKDVAVAREYWQQAVDALKALPHPYIALDVSDLAYLDPDGFPALFASAFSAAADGLSGSDELFGYAHGVPPRALAEFMKAPPDARSRDADFERRNHNACILRCPEYIATDFKQDVFQAVKTNAERGQAQAMFMLGRYYLDGYGTVANTEEGLRWCGKAAEAGYKAAAGFLSGVYQKGLSGVKADKVMAARWMEFSKK